MTRYLFKILVIALIIMPNKFYCNAEDYITVAGKIINIGPKSSRTITINECDPSDESVKRVVDLNSTTSFCEKIPFSYPHTFSINYTRGVFFNIYAEPGDSIHITIDAAKKPFDFHVSGDKGNFNEQYSHAYNNLSPRFFDIKLPPDSVPYQEFIYAFKQEYDRISKEVNVYAAENNIDSDVNALLHTQALFDMANIALEHLLNRSDKDQISFITDDIFDLNNPDNTKVMIFPYHIFPLASLAPEFATTLPKSTLRDIMYVKMAEDRPSPPLRSDFNNPRYYDRIFGQTVQPEINLDKIPSSKFMVYAGGKVSELKNSNVLNWIKDTYKGKPVYLDVSATWCGPCRASLKYSKDLRSHFKDSNIVFVILWLKSELETWKKLAPTINDAVQIFVNDDDTCNLIIGALGVRGFPTYIFINKDGSFAAKDDVPHFTSPELADYLKSKM